MALIYSYAIGIFGWLIRLAAPFNSRAAKWIAGRRGLFERLEKALEGIDREKTPVIWFHVSSLGEFEQGRPVIEAYRKSNPRHRILLTFFSPSGYEVRKNWDGADWIFYLPLDTRRNARRWVATVRPSIAVFVKYDFWYNMMAGLREQEVPLYFISVLFRPGQIFFRRCGGWFRRQLVAVNWFFVQDEATEKLLLKIGLKNVSVTGDTRFDRVFGLATCPRSFPLVEKFAGNSRIVICGSTWKEDEALLFPLLNGGKEGLKFIIAPHDVAKTRTQYIEENITRPLVRLSELDENNAAGAEILLVDSVGVLAHLYRYASLAYIGGAFGAGLHNIQEPITFGVPVFFGPGYGKFREAVDLVALGGAICVTTAGSLSEKVTAILSDDALHRSLSAICRQYVDEHRGATEKVMAYLSAQALS